MTLNESMQSETDRQSQRETQRENIKQESKYVLVLMGGGGRGEGSLLQALKRKLLIPRLGCQARLSEPQFLRPRDVKIEKADFNLK